MESMGNIKKQASYKLAHQMIDDAIRKKCPLQAIAIEESILSDRLWAAINSAPTKHEGYETLGGALHEWKEFGKDSPIQLCDKDGFSFRDISDWCDLRNKLLHGIVKSSHGHGPKISEPKFMERAVLTARKGLALVRRVENWSKRQVRKAGRGRHEV